MNGNLTTFVMMVAALALAACGGQKAPAEGSAGSEELKGKAGVYYYVTVSRPVGGTISSGDGKIDCGTSGGVTKTLCGPARYEWLQTATLSAYPDPNPVTDPYLFQSWAGDCCGDVADRGCVLDTSFYGADKWVAAVFNPIGKLGHGNIASPSLHAPKYFAFLGNDAGAPRCTNCHGQNYAGQSIAPSCNACHAAAGWANWQQSCSFCHGLKSPITMAGYAFEDGTVHQEWAAPPDDVNGRLTGTNGAAAGAHQAHVAPNEFRNPIACSECHVVPTTAIHTLNASLDLPFGPLSKSQGAVPTWDAATLTCGSNYCHGNFKYGDVEGKKASLTWGGSLTGCTTCHDMPPVGHAASSDPSSVSCSTCHGGTVNGDGTINVAGGLHINGQKDGGGGHEPGFSDPAVHGPQYLAYRAGAPGATDCTNCHGTTLDSCNTCHSAAGYSNWQTNCNFCHAYPPATGAHVTHFGLSVVNPSSGYGDLGTLETRSPAGATPVDAGTKYGFGCGNCHPTDESKHMNGTTDVDLLPPSGVTVPTSTRPKDRNAANPGAGYDAGTGKCSGVYCHSSGQDGTPTYAQTPAWSSTAKIACNGCHSNPPKYTSGGAGTATANSHVQLDVDGYPWGHYGFPMPSYSYSQHGQGWVTSSYYGTNYYNSAPLTCQTCHFGTTDPSNTGTGGFYYLDTSGDYTIAPNGYGTWGYACTACHGSPTYPTAPVGTGKVLPLRHVNGTRDVEFDARTGSPNVSYVPGPTANPSANNPTRPYWITSGSTSRWGAEVTNATFSGTTVQFDLSNSAYDPSTKTCTNVACHLSQGNTNRNGQTIQDRFYPLQWGATYYYMGTDPATGVIGCNVCHRM